MTTPEVVFTADALKPPVTTLDGWLVSLVAFEITLIGGGMFLFWWRFG